MQDNFEKDRMEDFLRNAFEKHRESPSPDLWNKIDRELGPASAKAKWLSPKRILAIAAFFFLAIFIGQHIYFEHRVSLIQSRLQQSEQELKTLREKEKFKDSIGASSRHKDAVYAIKDKISESIVPNSGEKNPSNSTPLSGVGQTKLAQVSGNRKPNDQTPWSPPATLAGKNLSPDAVSEVSSEMVKPSTNSLSSSPDPSRPDGLFSTIRTINQLASSTGFVTSSVPKTLDWNYSYPNTSSLGAKPHQAGKWKLGALVGLYQSRVKVDIRENPLQGPPNVRNFKPENTTTGYEVWAGLGAEYSLSKHASVESGLFFRQSHLQNRHSSVIPFRERRPPKDPMDPRNRHLHDFDYQYTSSSGLYEITVRASESDSTQQVPDNEMVHFSVNTREKTSYLSVPLAAKYSFSLGKAHGYAKAGLIANFLLASDVQFQQIISRNPRFRVNERTIQKDGSKSLKAISADYMVGVGLDYPMGSHVRLRLEPSISGNIGSRSTGDFIQTQLVNVGGQAGLVYVF